MLAYAVGWFRGGQPERLAVGILIFYSLLSGLIYRWDLDDSGLLLMALNCARLVIFGWLCFRLDRWWPLVITAAVALMVFMHFAELLDSSVSHYVAISAVVGLGYLVYLTLLFSVCERWLAGEPAAGRAAWARVSRAAEARRVRRGGRSQVSSTCPPPPS